MITVANRDARHREYNITHLRNREKDGKISPLGGITVVYKLSPDSKPNGFPATKVKYAMSVCRDNDCYDRRYGRGVAMSRLENYAVDGSRLFNWVSHSEHSEFAGVGVVLVEISLIPNYNNELFPSRWEHVNIVRTILEHAAIEGLNPKLLHKSTYAYLHKIFCEQQYPELSNFESKS